MNDEIKTEDQMEEGTSVREAEIIKEIELEEDLSLNDPVASKSDSRSWRYKMDFYIELALFLVLGILVGISAKTEAKKYITVGFDDYKMKIERQDYNINQLQTTLDAQQAAAQAAQQNAASQDSSGQIDQGQGQTQNTQSGGAAGQGNQG